MDFSVIIPARYASSRLPAKLLIDINGKTLIEHTCSNAVKSDASRVIIATDDVRIKTIAEDFGAEVCMTNDSHTSGTSRLSEVVSVLNFQDNDVVVNLQGDEPMIDPKDIINLKKTYPTRVPSNTNTIHVSLNRTTIHNTMWSQYTCTVVCTINRTAAHDLKLKKQTTCTS